MFKKLFLIVFAIFLLINETNAKSGAGGTPSSSDSASGTANSTATGKPDPLDDKDSYLGIFP